MECSQLACTDGGYAKELNIDIMGILRNIKHTSILSLFLTVRIYLRHKGLNSNRPTLR